MLYDQQCEAYRIGRGINRPISEDRIYHITRILSFSAETPLPVIPGDVVRAMVGDLKADPLESRTELAIGWAIDAGYLARDPENPKIILPNH